MQDDPASQEATAASRAVQYNADSLEQIVQAALDGKIEIIDQALENGFKVDMRDEEGRTILMYAAFNGRTDIIKRLIEAGADVNAQDQTGTTALMFAASGPNPDAVQMLLDHGAKVDTADNNEHWTALMWAGAEGQTEVVKVLLAHHADATIKEADGDTAESFAAKNGHGDVVAILQAAASKNETAPEE
jgi:hypothetical protein